MAEFTGRDLHLLKKALAIAVLAIENDAELAHYARAARIAVRGEPG